MEFRTIGFLCGIGIGVALLLTLLSYVVEEGIVLRKLDEEGVRTKGTITAMRRELIRANFGQIPVYYISCTFMIEAENNKAYTVERSVVAGRYRLLSINSEVEVVYLPTDPTIIRLQFD